MKGKVLTIAVAAGLFLLSLAFVASCQPMNASDQNKTSFSVNDLASQTVTLIVPHGAGGGYDTYARMIAPFIEKHTGAVVVVDNISGAAGVVGRNELWLAEPDGYTIGITAYSSIIMNEITDLEAAEYVAEEFAYLAKITGEPTLIAANAAGQISSFQELLEMEMVKYGEPSVVDDTYFNTMVFGSDHQINIVPVTGYEGTADLMLALFRNEFDILNRSLSNLVDFIDSGEVVPLVLNGFARSDQIPYVPTMLELAESKEAEGHALLFATMVENSRGFLAPPGTESDVVAAWQEVLEAVLNDPELIEMAKRNNLPINYLSGEEVSELILEAVRLGEEIKPLIKQLAAEAE